MIVVLTKWCRCGYYLRSTFHTRAVKTTLHLVTTAKCRWHKCSCTAVQYTTIMCSSANTRVTSSLQGRHINDSGGTCKNSTCARACSFFQSAGDERWQWWRLHNWQERSSASSGNASCFLLFRLAMLHFLRCEIKYIYISIPLKTYLWVLTVHALCCFLFLYLRFLWGVTTLVYTCIYRFVYTEWCS